MWRFFIPRTSASADALRRLSDARLPLDEEWEWVARGSEGRKYPWGSAEPSPHHASFGLRFRDPAPVGIYPLDGQPQGVRDLAGNVLEWCQVWYDVYEGNAVTNPLGAPGGPSRVLRGGSFYYRSQDLRAAYRGSNHPGRDSDDIGFRVVWSEAGGQ